MDIPYVKIETNKNTYALVKKEVIHNNLNIHNLAQKLSSKPYGVSCDGIIVIDDHYKPIPSIWCYNPTGSESPLSINSLIASGYYLFNTLFKKNDVMKVNLNHTVYDLVKDDDTISVNMNILNYYSFEKVRIGKTIINGYFINIGGSNHYYILDKGNLTLNHFKQEVGKKISKKYHANVGLIQIYNKNNIRVITFEHGLGLMTSSGSTICGALYILNREKIVDDIVEVDTLHDSIQCEINHNKITYKASANIITKGVFYL